MQKCSGEIVSTCEPEGFLVPDKMDHISFFVDEPQATRLKKMGGFLAAFKESHHALRRQGQENFNIFPLLRVGEDEVR